MGVVATAVGLTVGMPLGTAASAPPPRAQDAGSGAWVVRDIDGQDFGMGRPSGLAWHPGKRQLLVVGPERDGGARVVAVTPTERRRGSSRLTGVDDPSSVALAPSGRLSTGDLGAIDPAGAAYTPDGKLHVLDAATNTLLTRAGNGRVQRAALAGLEDADLSGLAYHPVRKQLYVAEADGSQLHAVETSGEVTRTVALPGGDISSIEAMTFAPSGDSTDPAREQSLYLASADSGAVTEVSLVEVAADYTGYSLRGTLVQTRQTDTWSPPSPDPSGVAYLGGDRLLLADGEVEELGAFYQGVNLYTATTSGGLVSTGTSAGPTTAGKTWSNEPVGAEYIPSTGHLLISDDGQRRVFDIPGPGGDGIFGTTDDPTETSWVTGNFGSSDPEGVAYDSTRGHVVIIDGVNREIYRASSTGGFVSQSDVARYGLGDPEGIGYDADRESLFVVDQTSEAIYEFDEFGSMLGRIDISNVPLLDKPAGITVAPSTSGGGRSFFVVDRGNDSDTGNVQNDGMVHEIKASLPDIDNRPPTADAGPDQVIGVSESAELVGNGVDPEGEPVTFRWSGPAGVTFSNPTSAETSASFTTAGTYTLTLTVSDGVNEVSDPVSVRVFDHGAVRTVSIPIATGSDDAREGTSTPGSISVQLNRAHHRLGGDFANGSWYPVTVGLRFTRVPIPQGSEVLDASIQFTTESTTVTQDPSALEIRAQDADDALTFADVGRNITGRPTTAAKVDWSPPRWRLLAEAGVDQRTPDLAALVQQVVNRPGWVRGNALAFIIKGTGTRSAESFEGTTAPRLSLSFRAEQNTAPVVSAGSDTTATTSGTVSLQGSATDDGLPNPPAQVTTTWSKVSGPGTVTFGDATKAATTAAFSEAGDYVLRLTADDGELTAQDEVAVSVSQVATMSVTARATRSAVLVGKPTYVTGSVSPALDGHILRLQQRRSGRWANVATQTLAEADRATYRFRVVPGSSGSFRYRVLSPAQDGWQRTTTSAVTVQAYRAALVRIRTAADVAVVRNTGNVAIDLKGWRLVNRGTGRQVTLPRFTLSPERSVRIHSGRGRTTRSDLYLRTRDIWRRHGVADLRDRWSVLVDRLRY